MAIVSKLKIRITTGRDLSDALDRSRAAFRSFEAAEWEYQRLRAVRQRFDLLRDRVREHYRREQAKLEAAQPRLVPDWLAFWRWSAFTIAAVSIALLAIALYAAVCLLIIQHRGA